MPKRWSSLASPAAAGQRTAILRHLRHLRHQSHQIMASKWFAPMTQNAELLAACVMDSAFASCARPFVPVAPCFGIDPMSGHCGL
jgi:hypothetical protein